MSHPATRVLALLELLQTHRRMGGPELAERLGVDVRTVRRYAARLGELGIPVEADRGRHGGYRLLPGYKLPPLMLSNEEAVAVVLGLLAGERMGLATAAPATAGALAKVHRILPPALRERTLAVQETLGFTVAPREAPNPSTEILLALGDAARRRLRLCLGYRSWRGGETERDFDPYGLVFHAGRWYVAGHDHRRNQVRTFRVDRVLSAEARQETFGVPDGFDAVEHLIHSLAGVPYAWQVEVLLTTSISEARRRVPPMVGTLTEADGGVLLRTRAERLSGMAQTLAGLGWPFVIQRPEELREAVRDLGDRLTAQADRRTSS